MTKRLPRLGEVWFDFEGDVVGPLIKNSIGDYQKTHPLRALGKYTYKSDGRWSIAMGLGEDRDDLAHIHKDATGKVIHPTFDPALIGQDEEKREPKAYEFWEHEKHGTAWLEPNKMRHSILVARVSDGRDFVASQAEDPTITAKCWNIASENLARELSRPSTQAEIEAWIAKHGKPAKYNPEAREAKKGPMNPETTPITQAIETAKARLDGLQLRAAKEAELAQAKDNVKALSLEVAKLQADFPIDVDKPKLAKPKAKKRSKV